MPVLYYIFLKTMLFLGAKFFNAELISASNRVYYKQIINFLTQSHKACKRRRFKRSATEFKFQFH